jgi:hypothetical protein
VVSYRQKAWRLLQENNKLRVLLQNKEDGHQNHQQTFIENEALPLIVDDPFFCTDAPLLRNYFQVSKNNPFSSQKNDNTLKKQKHHSKKKHRAPKKEHFLSEKEQYLLKKEEHLLKREECLIQKEDDLGRKEKTLLRKEDTLVKKEEGLLMKEDTLVKKEECLLRKEDTLVQKEDVFLKKKKNLILKKTNYHAQNKQSGLKKNDNLLKTDPFSHRENFLLQQNSPIHTSKHLTYSANENVFKKENLFSQSKLTLHKTNASFEQNSLDLRHQDTSPQSHDVLYKKRNTFPSTKDYLPTTEMHHVRNNDIVIGKEEAEAKYPNWLTNTQHSLIKNTDSFINIKGNLSKIFDSHEKIKHYRSKSINGPLEKCDPVLKEQNSTGRINNPFHITKLNCVKNNASIPTSETTQIKNGHYPQNVQDYQLPKRDYSTSTDTPKFQIQHPLSRKNCFDLVNKIDTHPVSKKIKTKLFEEKPGCLTDHSVPLAKNSANFLDNVSTISHPIKTSPVSHVDSLEHFEHHRNAFKSSKRSKHNILPPISPNENNENFILKDVDRHNSVKLCQNQKRSPSISPSIQRDLFENEKPSAIVEKHISPIYTGDSHAVSNISSSDMQSNETSLMPLSLSKIDVFENSEPKQFRRDMNNFLSTYPTTMDTEDERNHFRLKYPVTLSDDCLISKGLKTHISKNDGVNQTVRSINNIAKHVNPTESNPSDETEPILDSSWIGRDQNCNRLVESTRCENDNCKNLNSIFSMHQDSIGKTKYFTVKTHPLFPPSYNIFYEEAAKDNKNSTMSFTTNPVKRLTDLTEQSSRRNKPLHEFLFNNDNKDDIPLKNKENLLSVPFKNANDLSTHFPNMMPISFDDNLKVQVFFPNSQNFINPYAHKKVLTYFTANKLSDPSLISNGVKYELMRQKLLKKQAQHFLRANITFQSSYTLKKNSYNPENEIKCFLRQQLYKVKQELFNSERSRKNHFRPIIF